MNHGKTIQERVKDQCLMKMKKLGFFSDKIMHAFRKKKALENHLWKCHL
jgi:hypothetical protein